METKRKQRTWTTPHSATLRIAARGGGEDALGLLHPHHKPLLADHRVMEEFGSLASLSAKAEPREKLLEALACICLVAAKPGTKGKLSPLQTGTTFRRLVGAALVAHDEEKT